jgi:hypothetical protein
VSPRVSDPETPFHLEDRPMTRLTLAMVAWMSFAAIASASLTPRKEPTPLRNEAPKVQDAMLSAAALELALGPKTTPEFVVTDQTEILLDGKPCRYEAVPAHAVIVRMEVSEDKKTVLKIHFRVRK